MAKTRKKISKSKKAGLPQGALVYVGDHYKEPTTLEVYNISENKSISNPFFKSFDEAFHYLISYYDLWINYNGLTQIKDIQEFCNYLGIRPLLIEDVLNTEHRPKVEFFDNTIFVIIKMIYPFENQIRIEHLCIILKENKVVSFQEADGDVFDFIRKRIVNPHSEERYSSKQLFISLLDNVIDSYYSVIELFLQQIDTLEDEILNNPTEMLIPKIQHLKKEIIAVRRAILPVRELITRIDKIDSNLLSGSKNNIADLNDHILQLTENIEICRESAFGLMDLYLSSMSQKMNTIMQVLTTISVIFIPLTFIVGVYGMNFEHMPELKYRYGYYIIWAVMILIVVGMFFYFKKKKWFANKS